MQDIDCVAKPDGINCTIGTAIVILNDFQHACGAESLERLGLLVFSAMLSQVKCIPKYIHHF